MSIALGPGNDGAGISVGRNARARAEVVQTGPRGHILRQRTVVVATAIVDVPMKARRGIALGAQILVEPLPVECPPSRILGALVDRNRKQRFAIVAANALQ